MLEINAMNVIQGVQGLAWLGDGSKMLLSKLSRLEMYESGEIVYQGSGKCDNMHIVVSGNLHVMKCRPEGEQLESVLYEKDIFDLSFLYDRKLGYEVILVASTTSLVLTIPVSESQRCILGRAEDRDLYAVLKEYYEAYAFVRSSTTFGNQLSPKYLVEFVSSFKKRDFTTGQFVFRQGDDPDGYYICISGRLKVIVEVKGEVVFTTELKPGDYFGELALTTDSKRSASIRAEKDSACYFLSRQVFDDLVKKETQVMEGFKVLAKLAYG